MLHTFRSAIITPLLDFIYPPLCLICTKYLPAGEKAVCSLCWSGITEIHSDHPVWKELEAKFKKSGAVHDFISCYLFEKEGNFQHVVHSLKYEGMKSLGVRLGREIGKRMMQYPNFCKADYIIPVPLHPLKKRERGYNQSEYICRGISEVANIPVITSLIIRKKYTQSQTQLNIEERRENVGNAFIVPVKRIAEVKGKACIIVDDVITTGATINSCANELIANGAMRILATSAALAQ